MSDEKERAWKPLRILPLLFARELPQRRRSECGWADTRVQLDINYADLVSYQQARYTMVAEVGSCYYARPGEESIEAGKIARRAILRELYGDITNDVIYLMKQTHEGTREDVFRGLQKLVSKLEGRTDLE